MAFTTIFMIFNLILWLLLVFGIILLQMYLSKRVNKWPGLILPGISFLFSCIYPLNMAAFDGITHGITLGLILNMLLVWVIANIPTFVFIGIYLIQREKLRQIRELDKMKVQDL